MYIIQVCIQCTCYCVYTVLAALNTTNVHVYTFTHIHVHAVYCIYMRIIHMQNIYLYMYTYTCIYILQMYAGKVWNIMTVWLTSRTYLLIELERSHWLHWCRTHTYNSTLILTKISEYKMILYIVYMKFVCTCTSIYMCIYIDMYIHPCAFASSLHRVGKIDDRSCKWAHALPYHHIHITSAWDLSH